ncbi:hypothetical protein EZV62_012383 [Acer yangbiense]|uniref:Uncharacterized protein n=1 Tax=Acer yangbiense TaxID=1000413 RepID=A0A5C7HVQ6_9ROSI|nr:hypothetical protein EZV62_012383 [Acer yangbiense]
MMEAVGLFGPGYKEPSRYQLSEPLLKEEVGTTFLSSKESGDEAHIEEYIFQSFTKKDIVRLGVTRFASAFLTLQSLVEKKDNIRAMFISTEWDQCKWSKTAKAFEHQFLDWGDNVLKGICSFGEAIGADEMTQPRRSARVQRPKRTLEEEFESEDEPVEEDDFEFESDKEQVLETYGEEQEELDT